MSWSYTGTDPGLALFTACLKAGAPMPILAGQRILEIGCCEADWLSEAHKAWPGVHLVGIDQRGPNVIDHGGLVERKRADAMQADLFAPESFAAIVSLSAIEHVGLGHYKDPLDPDGDTKAIANAWRWLKPGGWIYFDVPYDPTGYRVQGTKCRVYDEVAVDDRLFFFGGGADVVSDQFRERFKAYAEAKSAGVLVPEPRQPVQPFHYIAMVWQKCA